MYKRWSSHHFSRYTEVSHFFFYLYLVFILPKSVIKKTSVNLFLLEEKKTKNFSLIPKYSISLFKQTEIITLPCKILQLRSYAYKYFICVIFYRFWFLVAFHFHEIHNSHPLFVEMTWFKELFYVFIIGSKKIISIHKNL